MRLYDWMIHYYNYYLFFSLKCNKTCILSYKLLYIRIIVFFFIAKNIRILLYTWIMYGMCKENSRHTVLVSMIATSLRYQPRCFWKIYMAVKLKIRNWSVVLRNYWFLFFVCLFVFIFFWGGGGGGGGMV